MQKLFLTYGTPLFTLSLSLRKFNDNAISFETPDTCGIAKIDVNSEAVKSLLFNSYLNSLGSCEHWKRHAKAKSYNFSIKQNKNLHETENTRICSVREARNSKLTLGWNSQRDLNVR